MVESKVYSIHWLPVGGGCGELDPRNLDQNRCAAFALEAASVSVPPFYPELGAVYQSLGRGRGNGNKKELG
jgi:hypothetical protein